MKVIRTLASVGRYLSVLYVVSGILASVTTAQTITFTDVSVASDNLKVEWSANDPERVETIKWNPQGLNGTEQNLTRTGVLGTGPCYDGLVEYFGNSWAPPDPHVGGIVLVGAGTNGVRTKGPDSKFVINSVSDSCAPVSAEVAVNTLYKFWRGGQAANKMRVTRSFTFESAFDNDFRPFIPRFDLSKGFTQVLHPNVTGSALVVKDVYSCPVGCALTDWDGDDEALSWFAIHNPSSGQGILIKRTPNGRTTKLWIDYDGASNTNASSVLFTKPTDGFTGEVTEVQTLCFYDSTTWIPTLESLPPGC